MRDEIKEKIEDEAARLYPYHEAIVFNSGEIGRREKNAVNSNRREWIASATYGYNLAQSEIERLEAWKKEALEVTPDMQAIGKALNVPLGETVHDKILPGIEQLKDQVKNLEKMLREAYKNMPRN